MDLLSPTSSTNSLVTTSLTPVFGDNVQDLLNAGALNVQPTGIIVVNSIADAVDDFNSGVTTLRDAISQANADTGEDLIVFDRSLFSSQQTITLKLGELDITHNLDIIAPTDTLTGEDLVTVSGNNSSRVFEIGSQATVNLSGLIVESGNVTGDDGGGIKNSGTLTLDSSIVRNDSARNGGGIFNDNDASLTVTNSTLSGNSASTNTNGAGGGIYNIGGTVTVSNSTLSGNSAGNKGFNNSYGGGIYNNGTLTVSNSTISANSISSYGAFGGGIYNNDNAVATVSNSIIGDNSASVALRTLISYGGGICNNGILTVSNSTISGNSAKGFQLDSIGTGGGIYNNSTLTVSNSTISRNLASGYSGSGGGITNSGSSGTAMMTVINSTISDNSTSESRSGGGGGIANGGILTVSNSTISGNSAIGSRLVNGGGISNGGTLTVSDSTINGNSVNKAAIGSVGGGIASSGTANVRNTIIAGNILSARESAENSDVSGTFTSNGYNLIGDSGRSTGFGEATWDIVGTSDWVIDPRLAPLDFYGGSTQTIALLPDSPAIGAADPTVLDTDPTTDQRGFPRRAADGRADIGAFEFS